MSEEQPAISYPPYVTAPGILPSLFEAIKKAAVPPKFTRDFMSSILGLKSSSYQPAIPLLKRLEFIDQASVPTENYKEYKDDTLSKAIMAKCVKKAYSEIYKAHEYAHTLDKQQLTSKIVAITGASGDDIVIKKYVVPTFLELCKLADFNILSPHILKPVEMTPRQQNDSVPNQVLQIHTPQAQIAQVQMPHKLGLSYTINLNLPATTDIEVFHAIFKSLKEHILNE
ncbi:MAG: DUF5343 domain-containing protein [Nitrososphaera sp.]